MPGHQTKKQNRNDVVHVRRNGGGRGLCGGEWRRTAEQGAEHFMAKSVAAEKNKAGLRHAVVCPNVTGRTKEKIAQSKRARAGSLALVD